MAIDLNPYFAMYERLIRACFGDALVSEIRYEYSPDPEAEESGGLSCRFTIDCTIEEAQKASDRIGNGLLAFPGWFRLFVTMMKDFKEADDADAG